VPIDLVMQQLADALLLPVERAYEQEQEKPSDSLNARRSRRLTDQRAFARDPERQD